MMMIWWWWWLMMMMMMNILEKTAQITLCWGRPPQSLRVVKTELTLLGGLATACSRPCDQNKRQLSQHSLRLHFLLRSSFLKVPDYFFASFMLLMMIDDLSSERVHDKNIRKVIKHFQKTKSLAGASQNSLKIRYFRIFSSHQKNAIPDKNFVSR